MKERILPLVIINTGNILALLLILGQSWGMISEKTGIFIACGFFAGLVIVLVFTAISSNYEEKINRLEDEIKLLRGEIVNLQQEKERLKAHMKSEKTNMRRI